MSCPNKTDCYVGSSILRRREQQGTGNPTPGLWLASCHSGGGISPTKNLARAEHHQDSRPLQCLNVGSPFAETNRSRAMSGQAVGTPAERCGLWTTNCRLSSFSGPRQRRRIWRRPPAGQIRLSEVGEGVRRRGSARLRVALPFCTLRLNLNLRKLPRNREI